MTKIYFARLEAAHAFANMAETMAETHTDLDEQFEADQYTVLANMIWDELRRDDDNPHYPYFASVPNVAGDFATAVRENCEDQVHGQQFFTDLVANGLADHCYVGECLVLTQRTTTSHD
jgi:hypothetical protein